MSLFRRKSREPLQVLFYTKAVCPLCDVMKEEMARARTTWPYDVRYVYLDDQPRHPYRLSIPVLEIEGERALSGRWTADEFAQALERAGRSR